MLARDYVEFVANLTEKLFRFLLPCEGMFAVRTRRKPQPTAKNFVCGAGSCIATLPDHHKFFKLRKSFVKLGLELLILPLL